LIFSARFLFGAFPASVRKARIEGKPPAWMTNACDIQAVVTIAATLATTLIRKVEHWTAVSRIPASMRLGQDLPVGTENPSKREDHRESGGLLLSTKCVSYFNGW